LCERKTKNARTHQPRGPPQDAPDPRSDSSRARQCIQRARVNVRTFLPTFASAPSRPRKEDIEPPPLFRSPKMYSPFSKNTRKKTSSFAQKRARGKKTRRNATKRKETRRGDSKITRARNERCSQNVARTDDDDDDDDDGGPFFFVPLLSNVFFVWWCGFSFFSLSLSRLL
jgi:hypothetical protein